MATALLLEGCLSCDEMKKNFLILAEEFSHIPMFISYSDEFAEMFGVEESPSLIIHDFTTDDIYIYSGIVSLEDMKGVFNDIMNTSYPN